MNHRQSSREEDTGKGHRRIHSRNLSVHFPRPLASPNIQSTIAEDSDAGDAHEAEGQELEIKSKPFGSGFKFGAAGKQEPPDSADRPSPPLLTGDSTKSRANRRGHHHKHSISHNFFSVCVSYDPQTENVLNLARLVPRSWWNTVFIPSHPADSDTRLTMDSNVWIHSFHQLDLRCKAGTVHSPPPAQRF